MLFLKRSISRFMDSESSVSNCFAIKGVVTQWSDIIAGENCFNIWSQISWDFRKFNSINISFQSIVSPKMNDAICIIQAK